MPMPRVKKSGTSRRGCGVEPMSLITAIVILIIAVAILLSHRSKKRRGEVTFGGKTYQLWDPKWEDNPRVGVNCDGDNKPYYRGPDGQAYIRREDGFFPSDEIHYTPKEVGKLLSGARHEIRNLKARVEALERQIEAINSHGNDPGPPPTSTSP
jgi:hypothetical protein